MDSFRWRLIGRTGNENKKQFVRFDYLVGCRVGIYRACRQGHDLCHSLTPLLFLPPALAFIIPVMTLRLANPLNLLNWPTKECTCLLVHSCSCFRSGSCERQNLISPPQRIPFELSRGFESLTSGLCKSIASPLSLSARIRPEVVQLQELTNFC